MKKEIKEKDIDDKSSLQRVYDKTYGEHILTTIKKSLIIAIISSLLYFIFLGNSIFLTVYFIVGEMIVDSIWKLKKLKGNEKFYFNGFIRSILLIVFVIAFIFIFIMFANYYNSLSIYENNIIIQNKSGIHLDFYDNWVSFSDGLYENNGDVKIVILNDLYYNNHSYDNEHPYLCSGYNVIGLSKEEAAKKPNTQIIINDIQLSNQVSGYPGNCEIINLNKEINPCRYITIIAKCKPITYGSFYSFYINMNITLNTIKPSTIISDSKILNSDNIQSSTDISGQKFYWNPLREFKRLFLGNPIKD